jgi:hypothetical protein
MYRTTTHFLALALLLSGAGCDTALLPSAAGTGAPGTSFEHKHFVDFTERALPGPGTARRSTRARAVDVNGDGHLDLVIARQNGPLVVLINDGHGRFRDESGRVPATIQSGSDLVVIDIDGDGAPDLVVVGENNASVAIFLNDRHGRFVDVSARAPLVGPATTVASADVDLDGHPDILIGRHGPPILLMNDGHGHFHDRTAERLPRSDDVVLAFAFADLTGFGAPDLVIGTSDSGTRLLTNDGRGFFRPIVTALPLPAMPELIRTILVEDVDGDGIPDIFLANAGVDGKGSNRLLRGEGHGRFRDVTAHALPASLRSTTGAVFVDFERGGCPGLITTGDVIVALSNDGRGIFRDVTAAAFPATLVGGGFGVVAADFDHDGRIDLFFTGGLLPDRLLMGR